MLPLVNEIAPALLTPVPLVVIGSAIVSEPEAGEIERVAPEATTVP